MNTSTFSRKTIAIAVAAGLTLGGVQVVSAQAGHDLSGQAVAAEAGKLDPSVIKSHSVISDKSKTAITTEKDTFSDIAGRDAFVNKHGTNVNFDVTMQIPDKAKTGDSIAFKINGAFKPNMQNGNSKDVHAKDNNGEDFVIGTWKYNDADKTVTFTLSKDASAYKDREVHIQVPMYITPIGIGTADKTLVGQAVEQVGTVTLASDNTVLEEFKYSAPYEYTENYGNLHIWVDDDPIIINADKHGLDEKRLVPDVNTGTFRGSIREMRTGQADEDATSVHAPGAKIAYDPDATEARNFTVHYTIDNDNFHFEKGHAPYAWYSRGLDKWKAEERSDGMHYTAYERAGGLKEAKEDGVEYDVKVSDDGKTADLTIKNLAPHNAINLFDAVDVVGDYTPGDKFKVTGKFIDGVGKPMSAYDDRYTESAEFTYTMPSFAEGGSGVKYEKKAEMKAFVNGKDANDKNSAEQITGGKGKFSIDLKNTGTIGTTKATVKFPKGVTDANGKTERVIDLSDGSFAPGKTKKIDLGELNVPEGEQENKFTVEMNGFKSLSDPAWTNTAKTADPVDPTWDNAEVPDGGTKKIPAGGGAKDAPKGTKYELTGDHPDWITINPDTGEITAKPPKGTKPGKNQVTVTTKFPDGSTDTDKPVITVIHNDVFIDGKPDVKPDGTVTLHRNDGVDITFKVPTGSKVEVNKDGDLVITNPGEKPKTIKLKHITVTESGEPGTPDHKIIITDEEGNTHEFGTYDKFVTNVEKLKDGNYKVVRNDGTEWIINLKDIRDKIAALEAKESPSKAEIDKLKKELADLNNKVKNIDNRLTKVEGDITNLRNDLTKLENRVTKIEARLTKVEDQTDALTQCVAGAGMAGIPALLSIPLMAMTQLNIPGLKDLNTQIQKQIGMFNPELARQWERNGGVLQAGAALAGLAGMISGIAYIANQCDPMMQTDAAKETDLGQLSSKLEDAKAGSSDKGDAKDTGSSIDAGSSAGEGSPAGEDK